MSGEKPQSENPFEYGDEWADDVGTKRKVLAVKDDMVCVEYTPGKTFEWYIFRNLLDRGWCKLPARKWEDLTAENWREHVGKIVWMNDGPSTTTRARKLIWHEVGRIPYPFFAIDESNSARQYRHASIYNDDGEEARWEEVQ